MLDVLGAALALHLIPAPSSVTTRPCSIPLRRSLNASPAVESSALELINERWRALRIPAVRRGQRNDVVVSPAHLPSQAYTLNIANGGHISIAASDPSGVFYAAMTLAQLPYRAGPAWRLPCVSISDAPALRWRILSDDVSRGPLPTMRYFKERIRTIAAFKMNGYSPYMEHVFLDPQNPLPAPLDGITPSQLRELAAYGKRYHVEFIPEQQTFAHMHNTLAVEKYATAADLPHAFLLSPAAALSMTYISQVIHDELRAIPHPRFFHIGSDETSTLALGQTQQLVQQRGLSQVYADHITAMNRLIAPSGARIMLWDDGIENDPGIMKLIPRSAVVVNWHYGAEKSFTKYINLIASGGFDQMVSPGANNWNQIYPDIQTALRNEQTFITEGKAAKVYGLFQTVWHDDGESLFEATWYPVLFSAANAWQDRAVSPQRFQADFPAAFFGTDDSRYGADIAALADVQARMADSYDYSSDYLFWVDPFDPRAQAHMKAVDLRAVRLASENVEQHLLMNTPPLHANAARVMFLAARKYDFIGRKFQAAAEIADNYAQAVAKAGTPHSPTGRDLYWCKYWFWELRDRYEELRPLYAAAWRYEDRESHLGSNLQRYNLASQQNIVRADRIYAATLDLVAHKALPPFDSVIAP